MSVESKSETQTLPPHTYLNEVFTHLIEQFVQKTEKQGGVAGSVFTKTQYSVRNPIGWAQFDGSSSIFQRAQVLSRIFMIEGVELKAPIGDYGEKWANMLVATAETLIRTAIDPNSQSNILREIWETNTNHAGLLDKYTFRRSGVTDRRSAGSKTTFAEGIQSILFVAGFLTMYVVPGYEDDPVCLLQDIAEQGLFSHLALTIAPTITARMGVHGYGFKEPAITPTKRKQAIEERILRHFYEGIQTIYKGLSTEAEFPLDKRGCPVARRIHGKDLSGVDMLAVLFAQTVASLSV